MARIAPSLARFSLPRDTDAAVRVLNQPDLAAAEIIRLSLEAFPDLALASSFSVEDVVLIDLMRSVRPNPRIFAIDTGRLPEEIHRFAERVIAKLGIEIEWYFPNHEAVEVLLRDQGALGFRRSVDNRLACCMARKVEPLARALAGRSGWLTGQRRSQSVTRARLVVAEIDHQHAGILKVNPLVSWSAEEVWDHIRERGLPYCELYDQAYTSIGCEPCTRPILSGENERAGRWWWESPEHKECGLHIRPTPQDKDGGQPS